MIIFLKNHHNLCHRIAIIGVLAGSVKDSVVGEERIAQYLLAILNCRGTPLHWKNLKDRKEECQDRSEHQYNVKDILPNRRKPPDDSAVHYIEV